MGVETSTSILETYEMNEITHVRRPASLLKRDSNTGVFPRILQNFYEQLFL